MSDTLDSIDLTKPKVKDPVDTDSITLKPKVKDPVDTDSITLKPKVKDHIVATPDAIKLARKYDPDGEGKLKFADAAASVTGMSKPFIYSNSENVAQHYFGKPTKPDSAAKMINDTFHDYAIDDKLNDIAGKAYGREYTEDEKTRMKELEAQKTGGGLKGFSKHVLDFVRGIVETGKGVVEEAGSGAAALSEDIQGLAASAMTLGGLASDNSAGEAHFRMGQEAAQRFVTKVAGASYRQKREAGESVASATITSGALAVFNNVMLAFPAGKLGDAIAPVAAETVAKVAGTKAFWAAANVVAKNGAFASANAAGTILINEFGKNLANKVDGKTFTWDDYGTVMKEFAEQAGEQTVGFSVLHGGMKVGGAFARGLKGVSDKAETLYEEPRTSPNAAGGAKVASDGADAKMAAAAKDHVAAMPIGDLDKPIPYEDVPRETTKTGGPVVDPLDKQVAKDPRVVAAKAQVPADSNRVSNIENQVYQEKFTEQHPAVVEAKKALQAALDDPTQADKVASLTEAFQSARKEANMMAAERGTQRVARERARVEGVATRNKYIQDIKDIQAKLPTMNRQFKGPIEDILKDYNTKNPMDSTMTKLKQLRAALSAPDSTVTVDQKLLDRLDEIDKVPLAKLPHEQFKALHDAVMALDKEATNQNTLWVNGKRMDRAVALNDAIAAMPPIKKTAEEWAKTSTRLGNAAEKIHKTTRALAVIGPAHYDTLVNMIGGGERSPVYDILGRQPDHAADTARDLHIRGRHVTADWLEKEKTTPEGYFDEKVTIPGLFEGVNRDVTITKGHLLSAWMHRQWDENWKHFTNGVALKGHLQGGEHLFTPNEAALDKAFADKLTDKDKEFLATHIAHIKEKITPEMQAKFQELNNHDMETPDFYWALNVAKYGKKGRAAVQDIVHQQIDRNDHYMGVNTSHVKPRVDSKAGIYWRPFQEDWASMIKFHSDYVGKATEMRNAAALLNSPEFREHLNKVYGDENTHAALVNGINAISGKRYVPDAYESGWMWLRQQGIKSAMNFNLHAAARNPFLATRSQQYIPYDHWLGGVMQAIGHPKLTHQELMAESSYYEEAGTRGTSQESQTALTRPGKFTKIGMAPEQASIRGTYRMEMTGVKNYAMDTFKKGKPQDSYWEYLQRSSIGAEFPSGIQPSDIPNLTMGQRKFYANQYAEYVAKRTHASPEPQFQSNFVLSGKPLPVMMMTLGSEGNAGWNMVVRGIMDAPHVKGGAVKLGKALFALGVLAPAADIGVKAAFNAATGKKQEPLGQMALEAGLNTVGEMLPGGTAITYPLSKIIEGKHTTQSNIVSQDATDALSAAESFARAAKAKHDRTKTSDFEHGAETTVGMIARLFGFPYWTLRGYAVGAYDIATGQETKK